MWRLVLAAALGLAATAALGAPGDRTVATMADGMTLVVPQGSPVKFAEQREDIYTFTGDFTVSGTFTFGYVHSESADATVQSFVFTPDAGSVQNLPHWPGAIDRIHFWNEDKFLAAAVPAATLVALKARQQGSVSGRVTVRAREWSTNYVCDTAYYMLEFTGLAAPAQTIAAQPLSDPGDC